MRANERDRLLRRAHDRASDLRRAAVTTEARHLDTDLIARAEVDLRHVVGGSRARLDPARVFGTLGADASDRPLVREQEQDLHAEEDREEERPRRFTGEREEPDGVVERQELRDDDEAALGDPGEGAAALDTVLGESRCALEGPLRLERRCERGGTFCRTGEPAGCTEQLLTTVYSSGGTPSLPGTCLTGRLRQQ